MRSYNVLITHRANLDLEDIGDYIAYTLLEPETAKRIIRGIRKKVYSLKTFPARGAELVDKVLREQGIKCLTYKNHHIFYQIIEESKTVIILRIGYNKRDWKNILCDMD